MVSIVHNEKVKTVAFRSAQIDGIGRMTFKNDDDVDHIFSSF